MARMECFAWENITIIILLAAICSFYNESSHKYWFKKKKKSAKSLSSTFQWFYSTNKFVWIHGKVGRASEKAVLKKNLMLFMSLFFILTYYWVKCNEASCLCSGHCDRVRRPTFSRVFSHVDCLCISQGTFYFRVMTISISLDI